MSEPSSPRKSIPDLAVHDLRRTVGTNFVCLGVSKDVRARILNHVEGARSVTDAVYNQHEFWAEKRAALVVGGARWIVCSGTRQRPEQ